jgi:hypothetical protein
MELRNLAQWYSTPAEEPVIVKEVFRGSPMEYLDIVPL